MQLSAADLKEFTPPAVWFLDGLQQAIDTYSINTPVALRYFLANVAEESGGFLHTVENLNYSAKQLLLVFPSHFTGEEATAYEHRAEAIANRIYANRMGNGDEQSGDGWKFRGRGLIQITGKDNYIALNKVMGYAGELETTPDLLTTDPYAALSAGAYFHLHDLNRFSMVGDFPGLVKAINGGLTGLDARLAWLHKAELIWPG